MRRRRPISGVRPMLARAGIWVLNALLQDVVLRGIRSVVVPFLLAALGLGGVTDAWFDTKGETAQIDRTDPAQADRKTLTQFVTRTGASPRTQPPPVKPSPTKPDVEPAPQLDEPPYSPPIHLDCTDRQGNAGAFDLVVFSRAFSWSLSSEEEVQLNASEADFQAQLETPGMARFLQAPRVLAVGMASCEGFPDHREREIERAGKRARQLLAWIEAVRHPRDDHPEHVPLQALNLGVYAKPCKTDDTWTQRRIVLLALYETDPGLSLRDCLQDALRDEPDLRALATDYEPGLGPDQPFFPGNR